MPNTCRPRKCIFVELRTEILDILDSFPIIFTFCFCGLGFEPGFFLALLPLLFERLILKNEDDTIFMFCKILDNPKLGKAVKELYLASTLPLSVRTGQKAIDAIEGLQRIVERQLMPRLSALGVYFTRLWHDDEDARFVPLQNSFWKALHHQCPCLRTIILRNVGYSQHDSWLSNTIDEDIGMFKVGSSSIIPP